jgi:DNA-directed RNA polymerase subunit RPC12/RpoP
MVGETKEGYKKMIDKCLKCKKEIKVNLYSGHWQPGDKITCPNCGQAYVHDCDEAEGCCWLPERKV